MARYCGKIGYTVTEETDPVNHPGVWENTITERTYFGDIDRNRANLQNGDRILDDLTISNTISIVADPYALSNAGSIRYAEFMGTMWRVTGIEVQYPRLILTLGGEYNGPKTTSS